MNQIALVLAAVLTFGVGIAHSWLGEVRLIGPLLVEDEGSPLLRRSAFARHVLRFAWHITTLTWWGIAAAFAAFALLSPDRQPRIVLAVLAVTLLLIGLVILTISRGRHLAWPVFLLAAACAMVPVLG